MKKNLNILILIIALLIALSTFSGIYRIPSFYYPFIALFFFVYSMLSDFRRMSFGSSGLTIFIVVCGLSILINQPPSYFRSWERYALFLNIVIAFSPLIVCRGLNKNRVLLFDTLVAVMVIFSVASFIGYFFGINFFVRNNELLAFNEAGHFSGFTNHSMTLAPVSALSGIYCMSKALSQDNKKHRALLWATTFICFGAVLLSASRGALGGVVLAISAMIYRYSLGKIGRFFRYVLFGVAILALAFPLWGGLTQYVVSKNEYNVSQGGIAYSRETKMAARLYEIQNNFLTGVGFCVVDETVDSVDKSTGTIEPNSSWLGVFSMTGVVGFLVFLFIFIRAFFTAFRKIPDKQKAVELCGILAFFFVHMMIEGYVLAGNNYLCGMYWLTLGVIYSCANMSISVNE